MRYQFFIAKLCLVISLILVGTGCIIVPAIQGLSEAGMTEGDRRSLLPKTLKDFHDAMYWGSGDLALSYVHPDSFTSIRKVIRSKAKTERVVESKVDSVDFSDGSWTAIVAVSVKSFKVPVYVVSEQAQEETWQFSLKGGWKLKSIESQDASS